MTRHTIPAQRLHHDHRARELEGICHDLRQCVTAGLLLAQLPHDDLLDAETRRRFSLIQQTLSHAADLLATASSSPEPSHCRLDLVELAQQCTALTEFDHKVRFVSLAETPALVDGDPVELRRAVANMIDNARRAAGPGGDVAVRVGADEASAWVEVVDDGPGFGEIEHGTGRGLALIGAAARAGGGRLEICSGPGPGTAVRIVLPAAVDRQDSADPSAYSWNDTFQSP